MLYVTTRDCSDAFTAHRALSSDCAPDGGLYIPYILPKLDEAQLEQMLTQSFGENIAQILNMFFSAKLTGWDVDFCCGKNPVKAAAIGRKIIVAELWRNPGSDYTHFVKNLLARLWGEQAAPATNWARVAIKIAVCFATYAELIRNGDVEANTRIDLAVPVGDMTDPIAAYYARVMGLPVVNIIMCCDDNSGIWDLLNRGEIGTAPLDSGRKLGLERLIEAECGSAETSRYYAACEKHGLYILPEEQTKTFGKGLFAAVIGKDRIHSVINSVYRNNSYFMDPKTAVCFGGLQDHRAKVGESRLTLMFADQSPAMFQEEIQKATGITQEFVSALNKKV